MKLFKDIKIEDLTPMMRQYAEIKREAEDAILMYRIGDFYEMFFDDALKASKILGLALTGRDCGLSERAPMCGVPHHSALQYIKKLLESNLKVAISEQLEEASVNKTLVKRGIVKVFTPGTILENEYLNGSNNNFLVSVFKDNSSQKVSISYTDISTGELFLSKEFLDDKENKAIIDELVRIAPSEIIINNMELYNRFNVEGYYTVYVNNVVDENVLSDLLNRVTGIKSIPKANFVELSSLFNLMNYLSENKNENLLHIDEIQFYEISRYMLLDESAIKNLELTKSLLDGTKKGSLLSIIDYTTTPKGARTLKSYIERPLKSIDEINHRLDILEAFYKNPIEAESIRNLLSATFDIDRITAKLSQYNPLPHEMVNLRTTLEFIPNIKNSISQIKYKGMDELANIDENRNVCDILRKAIADEPSANINDGFVIRHGYDSRLDEIRDNKSDTTTDLLTYEEELKDITSIKNLRIKYNRMTGYYIEVTKGQIDKVPDYFIRIQTLKNAERYKTEKLKQIEYEVLNSAKIALELEKDIYKDIIDKIIPHIRNLKELSIRLADIDVLLSLAEVARLNKYTRPSFNTESKIILTDARHPVVEKMISEDFIPNSITMDKQDRIAIITGPNMSGKSTFMRTIAINQILAQMGSFVPCSYANVSIADKVFTRIGASDFLQYGKSTFMVEMGEVSYIIKNATKESLILLDEVGRGTGTYDGMSIARALLMYISKHIQAKTLFSTHYQELAELENPNDIFFNLTLNIKEDGDNILFLRKIKRGVTSKSYGIHVAKLAGLPDELLRNAYRYQAESEKLASSYTDNSFSSQVSIFNDDSNREEKLCEIKDVLNDLDINSITPMESINILSKLICKAKDIE